jgi:hypothetical protein
MTYELVIIQNYSADEHRIISSNNLPGFYSIKKTIWNIFSEENNKVSEFIERYNDIIAYRQLDPRTATFTDNNPYLSLIYKYSFGNINFLRDKTYLIILIQRKIRKYLHIRRLLHRHPCSLMYRSIHSKFPNYIKFKNINDLRKFV